MNLIVGPAGSRSGGLAFKSVDDVASRRIDPRAGNHAMVVRFVDPGAFERVARAAGGWLAEAKAIMLQFPPSPRQVAELSANGFSASQRLTLQGPATTIFSRPLPPPAARRDGTCLADRPPIRRLVIVDPCLGVAAGHYLGYASRLTAGAATLGLDTAWACHSGLDDRLTPPGVAVMRCFPRCFFDLTGNEIGFVDLSGELANGWRALLDKFDDDGTHFLVHSADAHQLRAIVEVLEAGGVLRSAIHVNFQTSPRFMPGRLAGTEAHAAVMRLRETAQWERSLFFWAETHRLGRWLSRWLGEEIPAAPYLAPASANRPIQTRAADAPPMLSFLGEGRPTKGFLDLPELLDAVAANPRLREGLRVRVQNWRPFRGDPAMHEEAVARIRSHAFVEIVEGVLDSADYESQLSRADILLLPYDPATYNLQGSGILIEGFSRGSIIIARAGIAAEDEGEHGVLFTYASPEEFGRVLGEIIADFANLSQLARSKAENFRGVTTADRYIIALDARARGQSSAVGSDTRDSEGAS